MHPSLRSGAVFLAFLGVSPALMAPSCYGKNGGSFGPSDLADIRLPESQPTGLGPSYAPLAVGAFAPTTDTAEVVDGDAIVVDRTIPGTRLHAVKAGQSTVRYQTSKGPMDIVYRALDADAIVVEPGWCAGDPCSAAPGDELFLSFMLTSGGTRLEAGDLCPLTLPPFTSAICNASTVILEVNTEGRGAIRSPLAPSLSLAIEAGDDQRRIGAGALEPDPQQ